VSTVEFVTELKKIQRQHWRLFCRKLHRTMQTM